jgi:hypothetical protein
MLTKCGGTYFSSSMSQQWKKIKIPFKNYKKIVTIKLECKLAVENVGDI